LLHSASGTLDAVQPFDFRRSLDFVSGFGPMSGEQLVDQGRLTKAVMVEGQPVVFRVEEAAAQDASGGGRDRSGGGSIGGSLRYELFSREPIPAETIATVEGRISFFLSLRDDVDQFYTIVREHDPSFIPVVDRLNGLHQVKFMTLLEISCWAILTQRIQRPIALRMKRALTERFGGSLEVEGRTYWAFPDRTRLEGATARQLMESIGNQRTTVRLVSLVGALDDLDENFLRSAPIDKAAARLKRVEGIGDWSSQVILFRGLGRIERLQPINVRPLEEVIKQVYGPERWDNREEEGEGGMLDEVNSIYGSWSGYWSLYLWALSMLTRAREKKGERRKQEGMRMRR
jgi:DNA-3-methyladenine glycosylase II